MPLWDAPANQSNGFLHIFHAAHYNSVTSYPIPVPPCSCLISKFKVCPPRESCLSNWQALWTKMMSPLFILQTHCWYWRNVLKVVSKGLEPIHMQSSVLRGILYGEYGMLLRFLAWSCRHTEMDSLYNNHWKCMIGSHLIRKRFKLQSYPLPPALMQPCVVSYDGRREEALLGGKKLLFPYT